MVELEPFFSFFFFFFNLWIFAAVWVYGLRERGGTVEAVVKAIIMMMTMTRDVY